jgi:hypothetical protein
MSNRKTLLLGGALVAAIASLVVLFSGWAGLREEPTVAAQMPYAVTGVGGSIVLMVIAAALASAYHRELLWQTLREDVAVCQDQLDVLSGNELLLEETEVGGVGAQAEAMAVSQRPAASPG